MWRLGRTETFAHTLRRLLQRDPQLVPMVAATLEQLEADPHHPTLKLHRLRGKLSGLWSVRVTYRIRLLLELDEDHKGIILVDIGSHDEVHG